MQEHIGNISQMVGPKAYCWDVVNEAVNDCKVKAEICSQS